MVMLREARRCFEELECLLWVARGRTELAASGMINRDIGAALSSAPRRLRPIWRGSTASWASMYAQSSGTTWLAPANNRGGLVPICGFTTHTADTRRGALPTSRRRKVPMCTEPHDSPGAAASVTIRPEPDAALSDPVSLVAVDAVRLTTLVDNYTDLLMPDEGPVRRHSFAAVAAQPRLSAGLVQPAEGYDVPVAEHGFSMLVTVTRAGHDHHLLFDAGMTPDGLADNMRRLGLSPFDIELIVLSHGHTDHVTGLDGLVRWLGPTNLPLVVHPGAFTKRRIAIPGGAEIRLPCPSGTALREAGLEVIERRQPSLLFDDSVLITGEVDRTTPFEHGMPFHEAYTDGVWEPDPLIVDDQALVVHVAGHGLVVLTGCGHAGIVNIVRYARRLTGIDTVSAVVGGFHLSGAAFEPLITPTVAALSEIGAEVIIPTHCTGWRAARAFAAAMPEAFVQNTVGARLELRHEQRI
jgi:7,8-dihydropterin-6-yl-methyl-4-(beta-D-ribofuranosyl)aminobenzene 5'-phosphate synthase